MGTFAAKPVMKFTIHAELSEGQARALEAISSYDADDFLKVFYERMGKAYLEPNEAGLRSLFHDVRNGPEGITAQLHKIDNARRAFLGEKT